MELFVDVIGNWSLVQVHLDPYPNAWLHKWYVKRIIYYIEYIIVHILLIYFFNTKWSGKISWKQIVGSQPFNERVPASKPVANIICIHTFFTLSQAQIWVGSVWAYWVWVQSSKLNRVWVQVWTTVDASRTQPVHISIWDPRVRNRLSKENRLSLPLFLGSNGSKCMEMTLDGRLIHNPLFWFVLSINPSVCHVSSN